jgi:hypothetical protein
MGVINPVGVTSLARLSTSTHLARLVLRFASQTVHKTKCKISIQVHKPHPAPARPLASINSNIFILLFAISLFYLLRIEMVSFF